MLTGKQYETTIALNKNGWNNKNNESDITKV